MDNSSQGGRLFFIDSENGFERLIDGCEDLNSVDCIIVFHRGGVPKKPKARIEACPAKIEWVTCVDPGVKNSMDFQIVAELALRLAMTGFGEGYVVSRDQGFNPALHYLMKHAVAMECELALASSIGHALVHSAKRALRDLEQLDSRKSIERAFSLVVGVKDAQILVDKISDVLVAEAAKAPNDVEKLIDLKGVGKSLSKRLQDAGVSTPAQLRAAGSVEAWRRIRELDASFSLRWLYVLESAITDDALGDIESERKLRLRQEAGYAA